MFCRIQLGPLPLVMTDISGRIVFAGCADDWWVPFPYAKCWLLSNLTSLATKEVPVILANLRHLMDKIQEPAKPEESIRRGQILLIISQ